VVIVEASSGGSGGYNELGRMKAVSGKCWSTPAFSNGCIYVRSTEECPGLVLN